MTKNIFLVLIRNRFENLKHGINGCQGSLLLFKYYVSKLGGGELVSADTTDTGGGSVKNILM